MDCRSPQTVSILGALQGKEYSCLIAPKFIVLPTGFHVLIFESHLAISFFWPYFLLTFKFGGIFYTLTCSYNNALSDKHRHADLPMAVRYYLKIFKLNCILKSLETHQ